MKNSIILKTILIIGAVIIAIFIGFGYLFSQNDAKLISSIREYNLASSMQALDNREHERLKLNQEQMEDVVRSIAKNSATYLLNYDIEGLKESLKFDMTKKNIKAIEIWDSEVNELFLLAIKSNSVITFKKQLPASFKKYTKFKRDINNITSSGKKEKLGTITIYYDESGIINEINQIKKESIVEIDNFNGAIQKQLHASNIIKLYMAIGALIAILGIITLLLIRFVNTPLKKLHHGLDSFFLFLQGKQDFTKHIEIDSADEFGQMAKSLNKNIAVSAKLHEDLNTLYAELEEKVEERTKELAEINQDVQDSIEYASVIQRSFLKNSLLIEKQFSETFVIWEPRDKVGGDLYIYEENEKGVIFGVVDCTGHSVPGGFMTMLAGSMIKKLATEFFDNPAKLLKELNIAIKQQLNQDANGSLSDDGLDIGLCFIDAERTSLKYSGAKLDLLYFKEGEPQVVKANKQSIGYKRSKEDYEYTNHEVPLHGEQSFYLYSDGITDQTGGAKNFPLGNKKFKTFLESLQSTSMFKQKSLIIENLEKYQQHNRRRDDITVIGFKIKGGER